MYKYIFEWPGPWSTLVFISPLVYLYLNYKMEVSLFY